jgi:hypothetical protein
LSVSVCLHIPIPFSNPHFPNPLPFPSKNIETEVEIGFSSVSIRFHHCSLGRYAAAVAVRPSRSHCPSRSQRPAPASLPPASPSSHTAAWCQVDHGRMAMSSRKKMTSWPLWKGKKRPETVCFYQLLNFHARASISGIRENFRSGWILSFLRFVNGCFPF